MMLDHHLHENRLHWTWFANHPEAWPEVTMQALENLGAVVTARVACFLTASLGIHLGLVTAGQAPAETARMHVCREAGEAADALVLQAAPDAGRRLLMNRVSAQYRLLK